MAVLVKAGGGENVKPEVTTYENLLQTAIANLQGKAYPPPVDPTDDPDLIPENIREGVDIWGVLGTLKEGLTPQDFGFTKMAKDNLLFTSNTALNQQISHSLGTTPEWAIVVAKDEITITNGTGLKSVIAGFETNNGGLIYEYRSSSSYYYTAVSGKTTMTSSYIQFTTNNTMLFQQGVEYELYTFA